MRNALTREPAERVARALLAAQAVSEAGDFVGLAALLLFSYGRSGSVIGPASVFAVKAVPSLLVGTVWSGWLDRPERRAALIGLALIGAVVVGVMAASPSLALALVVSAILQGTRNASFSIQAAVVVDRLPSERRGAFFASSAVINQTTMVLGYVVGAGLTTGIGARPALALDAGTFVIAAGILSLLPRMQPALHPRRRPATGGLHTIRTEPVLRLITPVILLGVIGAMLPETLAPRIAHGSALAIVMAAMPFGGLCTSLLAARTGVLDSLRRQFVAALLFGGGFGGGAVALALHAGWVAVAVANGVVGLASVWITGARTTFSRVTPPEQMTQVEATMVSSNAILIGGGTIALAAIALVSLPLAYALAGLPLMVAALSALGKERRLPANAPTPGAAVATDAP